MKSKLNRDYPLSDTMMSNEEKKKFDEASKEMDKKKILSSKVAGIINTTRSNIRNRNLS